MCVHVDNQQTTTDNDTERMHTPEVSGFVSTSGQESAPVQVRGALTMMMATTARCRCHVHGEAAAARVSGERAGSSTKTVAVVGLTRRLLKTPEAGQVFAGRICAWG